jgi:hypothetical protein
MIAIRNSPAATIALQVAKNPLADALAAVVVVAAAGVVAAVIMKSELRKFI